MMNKETFDREYMCSFEPDNSYASILKRVRFNTSKEIAQEITYRIKTQYELEEKIIDLLVQRTQLHEHIDNLKRSSQNYCMCGMRLDTHGSCGNNHASISEFDWYIGEYNL